MKRRRRLTGIAWAVATWSRVTMKQKSRADVVDYIRRKGWRFVEMELRYWLEQSKAGDRRHAPHPLGIIEPEPML